MEVNSTGQTLVQLSFGRSDAPYLNIIIPNRLITICLGVQISIVWMWSIAFRTLTSLRQ